MPDKDLGKLANRFTTNALLHAERFSHSMSISERAFAVISLYADWEEFSRRLLYSSAVTRPTTATGQRLNRAPNVKTYRDVLQVLSGKKRITSNHIVIHLGLPEKMVDACKKLDVENTQTITGAILSMDSPADNLRQVRNFLAHQNGSTATQVNSLKNRLQTEDAILWMEDKQLGGGSRFDHWAHGLVQIARASTQ